MKNSTATTRTEHARRRPVSALLTALAAAAFVMVVPGNTAFAAPTTVETAAATAVGASRCPGGVRPGPFTSFKATVPAIGSRTSEQCYRTTTRFKGISVRLTRSGPHDTYVKAVRCSDLQDIGRKRLFPAGYNKYLTLAGNPPDRLCFRLNFSAPTPAKYTVAGQVRR